MNPHLLSSHQVLRAWLAPTVLLPGDVDRSPIATAAAYREQHALAARAQRKSHGPRAWLWWRRSVGPGQVPGIAAHADR